MSNTTIPTLDVGDFLIHVSKKLRHTLLGFVVEVDKNNQTYFTLHDYYSGLMCMCFVKNNSFNIHSDLLIIKSDATAHTYNDIICCRY